MSLYVGDLNGQYRQFSFSGYSVDRVSSSETVMINGSIYTFMLENFSGFGSFLQTDTTVSLVDYIDESVTDAATITGDAMATEWLTGDETIKLFESNGQWYAAVALGAEGGMALFEVEDDGTGSDGELTYISTLTGTNFGTENDFDILDFQGVTYISGANAAQNSLFFYYINPTAGELFYGGDLSSASGRSLDDVARVEIISPTNPAYGTGYIIAAGPTDGVSLIEVSSSFPELANLDVATYGVPDEIAVYEVDGTIYLYSVDETSGVMWVYSIDPTTNTFVYQMGQNLSIDSGLSSVDVTDISFLDYGSGTLMAVGLEDTEALLLYTLDNNGAPVLMDVVPSSEINDVVSVELVEFDGVPYVAVVETDLGFISLYAIGENGDLIAAKGTGDELLGLGGDDTLLGYGGADVLDGGDGDDVLIGGNGNDMMIGGAGVDAYIGGNGSDTVDFSDAAAGITAYLNDGFAKSADVDVDGEVFIGVENIIGSDYDDQLHGNEDNNTLTGGGGADELYGFGGNDILEGGDGDDLLNGGNDDDIIYGGNGNDTVYGGLGADEIYAGDGADLIYASNGSDMIFGDAGNDIIYAGSDVDIVYGGADADTIYGGAHNDQIFGETGADSLYGEDGNDFIAGGGGADLINGGSGADTIYGGTDNDTIFAGSGADQVNGDAGIDTIYGGLGDDTLNGGAGDDVLRGADGYDNLDGGSDNDTLYGGNHDDILQGGSGNDTLYGQADDDRIDGGLGDDALYGGTGADTFVFAGTFGDDVIHDFTDGEDLIDLSGTSGLLSMVDVVSNWIQLGDDVMIADGGNTILIENTDLADLGTSDFVF